MISSVQGTSKQTITYLYISHFTLQNIHFPDIGNRGNGPIIAWWVSKRYRSFNQFPRQSIGWIPPA